MKQPVTVYSFNVYKPPHRGPELALRASAESLSWQWEPARQEEVWGLWFGPWTGSLCWGLGFRRSTRTPSWWSCAAGRVWSSGRCAWSADHTRCRQTSFRRCVFGGGAKAHRSGQTSCRSPPSDSWTAFHLQDSRRGTFINSYKRKDRV